MLTQCLGVPQISTGDMLREHIHAGDSMGVAVRGVMHAGGLVADEKVNALVLERLARPDAARAGREQNNVYLFLKSDIDSARESYRAQFMRDKSIVDYFHLELVRTAAEGDESKLGAEYPGPLA